MRRAVSLFAFVTLAAAALACESVLGVDYGSQRLATCDPAAPPGPPTGGDTGGTSTDFTVAIYTIDWGDNDDPSGNPRALSIGFDMDARCTSLFDAPACQQAAWTGASVTDGPHGIDNAVGLLLHDQGKAFGLKPFTSSYLTQSTQSGAQSPPAMFHVSNYSGFSDDGEVTVEWLVPVAPGKQPKWDGSDAWPILPGTADADASGNVVRSHYVDTHAYVGNFHLVAHFSGGPPVNIADVPVATVDTLISADLVQPTSGQWQLASGILAGVGLVSELFHDEPALSASFAGNNAAGKPNAICKNTPTVYPKIKQWLCSHADTLVGSGPLCDAYSFGMLFDTRPGHVGPVAPAQPSPMYCQAGADPTGDTCDTPP